MATTKKPTGNSSAKPKPKPRAKPKPKTVASKTAPKLAQQTTPDAPRVEKPKSAFVPLLLGGAVAGAVGFGAASYYFMNKPSDVALALEQVQITQTDQQKGLAAANTTIIKLRSGMDQNASSMDMAAGFDQGAMRDGKLAAQIDALAQTVTAFDARLTTLEKRPVSSDGMSSQATAAYERDLQEMRRLLAMQRADIEKMADQAAAKIENAANQAVVTKQVAHETAKATALRALVSDLQSALDNGGGFEAALSNLQDAGVDVMGDLVGLSKGGVPTLKDLQASYPIFARAALAVSIKANTGDGAMGKIGSFFRSQVGARSLEPREGDDPDAVLSRAEGALVKGDISGAIDLIGALPKVGQAEMTDWVTQAQLRIKALDAMAILTNDLNGN